MKKNVVLFLLIALLSISPLLSANNGQKIRSLDDDTYEAISYLYVKNGLSQPSYTAPYSDNELNLMLDKINSLNLSKADQKVMNYINDKLDVNMDYEGKGISFDWTFKTTIESFAHPNIDGYTATNLDFANRDIWVYDKIFHKPFLDLNFEAWSGDHVYSFADFSVGNSPVLAKKFGTDKFRTNIILISPSTSSDLDFAIPYRAFGAFGGDYWSFEVGRDRLDWGCGETGNLTVSDNLYYHNLARFTTFSDNYKYTFVTSFFPHQNMYINDVASNNIDDDNTAGITPQQGNSQWNIQDGIRAFIAHRLEFRAFHEKVGLVLTEEIMYESETNCIDLRVLNPHGIYHDLYIRANANSIIAFEADYTPVKGINIYGQALVDEFLLPNENNNNPSALGFLGGIKGTKEIAGYAGKASLEFAKTNPYLYLRDNMEAADEENNKIQHASDYGINFVVAIRDYTNNHGASYYDPEFLGYDYGGDALVFNANAGLKDYGKWSVEGNIFFMKHGTSDCYTCWAATEDTSAATTPTVTHPTDNHADLDAKDTRNAVSRTFVSGIHASYTCNKNFNVYGQIDFILINNYANISGDDLKDIQLTSGFCYSI
ncbi:MAG: hypothetical protein WC162_00990 [Sphaerochaetaceae bacterium]